MGDLFGNKQGPTTTSTATQQLSPQALAAQQQLLDAINTMVMPYLQQFQQSGVMGMNPLQTLSTDLAMQAAKNLNTIPSMSPYDVFGMGRQWQPNTARATAGSAGSAAAQAAAARMKAAQLAPKEIAPFMSPYIDSALNPTLDKMRQQQAETQAGIGSSAAAQHMFGGSREAVQRMIADRNYRQELASTTGNMLNQGYGLAAQLAEQNVAKRQEEARVNAQLANAVALQNAQQSNQLAIANAENATQASIANLQPAMQTERLGWETETRDADRFLQALRDQNTMTGSHFDRQLQAVNMLNNLGTQQQTLGQNALNMPFTRLNDLLNAVRAMQGGGTSTTVGTSEKPIDWASLLFGGLGLFSKLSDRDDKTDIKKLGIDPDTGLPFYAYRYKDDPKSYPKTVGPMADDLEKLLPGITKLIGGHKTVQGGVMLR